MRKYDRAREYDAARRGITIRRQSMGAMLLGGGVAYEGTEVEVVTAGVILARIFRCHWHLYKRVCPSAGPSAVFYIRNNVIFGGKKFPLGL